MSQRLREFIRSQGREIAGQCRHSIPGPLRVTCSCSAAEGVVQRVRMGISYMLHPRGAEEALPPRIAADDDHFFNTRTGKDGVADIAGHGNHKGAPDVDRQVVQA